MTTNDKKENSLVLEMFRKEKVKELKLKSNHCFILRELIRWYSSGDESKLKPMEDKKYGLRFFWISGAKAEDWGLSSRSLHTVLKRLEEAGVILITVKPRAQRQGSGKRTYMAFRKKALKDLVQISNKLEDFKKIYTEFLKKLPNENQCLLDNDLNEFCEQEKCRINNLQHSGSLKLPGHKVIPIEKYESSKKLIQEHLNRAKISFPKTDKTSSSIFPISQRTMVQKEYDKRKRYNELWDKYASEGKSLETLPEYDEFK